MVAAAYHAKIATAHVPLVAAVPSNRTRRPMAAVSAMGQMRTSLPHFHTQGQVCILLNELPTGFAETTGAKWQQGCRRPASLTYFCLITAPFTVAPLSAIDVRHLGVKQTLHATTGAYLRPSDERKEMEKPSPSRPRLSAASGSRSMTLPAITSNRSCE